VLWRFGICAHQQEAPVGVMRSGGPNLLPVDDVVIAIANGARLQAGEVAPGARLGVALAPDDVGRGDPGQMLGLLLVAAVDDQRRPNHPDVEDTPRIRGAGVGDLLAEDHLHDVAPRETAVLLRPGRRYPLARCQLLGESELFGPVLLARGPHRAGATI